jgi:hypothetical protein
MARPFLRRSDPVERCFGRGSQRGPSLLGLCQTVPLTLLTFANLFAALQAVGLARHWWLVAVVAAALDRASTFGYFIPTMLRLTRPDGPTGAEAASIATQWAQLDYIRHGLTLAALVAALCALTLLTETGR